MPSIRQNAYPDLLPDFRNLAVMARVLVGMNALALAGTLYATPTLAAALDRFVYVAAFLEPLLLVELMALFASPPWLARLPYLGRLRRVVALVVLLAGVYHGAVRSVATRSVPSLGRTLVLRCSCAAFLLALLQAAHEGVLARARRSAPAGAAGAHPAAFPLQQPERGAGAHPPRPEARRARARGPGGSLPHADGRRAPVRAPGGRDRAARALRRDRAAAPGRPPAHQLGARCRALRCAAAADGAAAAARERGLSRRRAGHRAWARCWCASSGAASACTPRSRIRYLEAGNQRAGNRMALDNIRERLALFFDAEARLETRIANGRYRVDIEIPYRRA